MVRVLGRHPPARRAGARRRARASASAAASSIDDQLPHQRPRHLRHRRVRAVRRPHLRPGRARLPHGRASRPRTLARRGDATLHRRRHEHQAQADGRRRRQLRRRLRPRRPARSVVSVFDDASAASTRSWSSAPTASACSAASSSATPSAYAQLLADARERDMPLPEHPEELILPRAPAASAGGLGVDALPRRGDDLLAATTSTKGAICDAIADAELTDVGARQDVHQGRHRLRLVRAARRPICSRPSSSAPGVAVTNHLCEHFDHTRQELFHLVRVHEHRDLRRAARAPRQRRAAARSASRRWRRSSPRPGTSTSSTREHAAAAGHQRPLPRQHPARRHLLGGAARAGRRDHARQLIALGQVAKKYGLYTKITGGQRVDLFGARVEQLPAHLGAS